MPRVRKIEKRPESGRNYYLVDACFLVDKYIPLRVAPDAAQADRLRACKAWWKEIVAQLKNGVARVYVPDVCIAESFKVLAKKYYIDKWFKTAYDYKIARDKMSRDLTTSTKALKSANRNILFHDISTCRDVVIAVDRFFEIFMKNGFNVQISDLIVLATAKYVMDYYDIPRNNIHIVTLDKGLWSGSKKVPELPNAYDPTNTRDSAANIFR